MEVVAAIDMTENGWNDDRLDEFARDVGKRFDQVDERFDKVDRRLDRIDDRMDAGFNRVSDRLDFLAKAMIAAIVSLNAGMLAGFAAIVALIATQL